MKLKTRYTRLLAVGLMLVLVLTLGASANAQIERAIERDCFSSEAQVTIEKPDGSLVVVELSGDANTVILVFFEGAEGAAVDDDDPLDGLDEVQTEIVSMELTGVHADLGPVNMRVNPLMPSLGEIEELQNNTQGILDVPPFTATGIAYSFFDVFVEIEVGGFVLHNEIPAKMKANIDNKPPLVGTNYTDSSTIPLLNAAGNATGYAMVSETHTVGPLCPPEVGGDVYPTKKLALLAPWLALAAVLIIGTAMVVRRRRVTG
jgi:hypothetical protein